MKRDEELIILTALQKAVKERLDEVRDESDEDLLDSFDEDGVTKRALMLYGEKMGDYLVTLTSAGWDITDRAAFEEFALAYGLANRRSAIKPEQMDHVISILTWCSPTTLEDTVEIDPKWQRYITNEGGTPCFMDTHLKVPGLTYSSPHPKGTQVRGCSPHDVLPVLQQLGGLDSLLLDAAETMDVEEYEEDLD